jgi:glycosyltransferase involved in cell wall biosynthesis
LQNGWKLADPLFGSSATRQRTTMNICLVTANFWPGWGGAERQCQLLARTLTRRGHAVTVLTRRKPCLPAEDQVDGVAVRRTAAFGSATVQSVVWTASAAAWLRRHARQFSIVQCYQLLSPSNVGILGCARSGHAATVLRPACSGPYGDIAEVRRLPLTAMRNRWLQRADAYVTLTREIEAELIEFGLGKVPFHRIPNGVDAAAFSPAPAEERDALRAAAGLPRGKIVCAFVGRLTRQKRPDVLLEAWSRCKTSRMHLVFVGDGPLRRGLEQQSSRLPSTSSVTFTGPAKDMPAVIRAMDIVVIPSEAEGMSNAMLEAMACGLPVVATDVGGVREVLGNDGKAGVIVPAGSSEALAEAMVALATSARLRAEVGAAARSVIEDRYDMRRVAAQHVSLYEELAG